MGRLRVPPDPLEWHGRPFPDRGDAAWWRVHGAPGIAHSDTLPGTWSDEFGLPGPDGGVYALAVYGGDLVVAGDFEGAGGYRARCVARWDGSSWHALGTGIGRRVR